MRQAAALNARISDFADIGTMNRHGMPIHSDIPIT
jgi:hypothetical protein